jgi:hypothetical protein
MKTKNLALLVALAGTTAAIAAPRESITFTGINSNGRLGSTDNAPAQTWAVTGSDAGGAYNARFLRVSGTIQDGPAAANWSQEQQILVTPPTGTPFIVSMFTGTGFTGTLSAVNNAIPVGAFTTAGNWTFQFHESFDDGLTTAGTATGNLVDAIWNTVTFTLDDAAPTIPSVGVDGVTFNDVNVDGFVTSPATTLNWNYTGGTPALPRLRVRGAITGLRADPTNQVSNPWSQWRIRITPPNGAAAIVVAPGTVAVSTLLLDGTVTIPNTVNPVGNWTFDFFEATGTTGTFTGTTVDVAGGPDMAWNQIGFELFDATPSGVVPVAADNTGAWVSGTGSIAAAGGIQWFSFTAPATLTGTGYLDIDTTGSNLSPVNDTDIALYLANGNLVDSDEDDAANLLSQLSYGSGNRQRIGNGSNFSGQDGTIVAASTTGISPGGNYFVAVAGGNAATHASVFNTVGGTNTGPVTLRVRAIDSGAVIETPTATAISPVDGGAWASATSNIASAGEIAWFTFTTPADLVATGAVDIDFEGTALAPANDTDAGVYTNLGILVDGDEDDGTDLLSQFSYGATGVRRNPTGNGLAFRGQDGTVAGGTGNLAANTQYYIAVAGGNAATQGSTFNPSTTGVNTGSVTARVRLWSASAPTEPATPPVGAETLAFPASNATTTDTESIASGGSKWYVLTVPVAIRAIDNNALQIDNEGSTTAPTANDTGLALYNASGTVRASDTSDGTDSIASLSFGVDNRPAPGNGLAYSGRDGSLAAGTYYLNVSVGGFPIFGTDFEVTALSTTQSGTAVTNVRYFEPSIDTSGAVPPATFTDAGLIGRRVGETESLYTFSSVTEDLNTVQWFRFNIIQPALTAGTEWLDIDTEGTNPAVNNIGGVEDSELGLYTNGGLRLADDNDDGSGWRSSLTFGQAVPSRAAINSAPQTGALARDGRDGELTVGTYWLAVSTDSTTHNPTNFNVVGSTDRSTTNTAARVVNFRTNLRGACGASDIAGPGPVAGADGEVTADDVIFFISNFTNNNLAVADIAGPGPVAGADGELTADDIILFITRFTAGCP